VTGYIFHPTTAQFHFLFLNALLGILICYVIIYCHQFAVVILRVAKIIYCSMAAAFGSGVMFSLVSGMGGANAVTSGVFFAIVQGGIFQVSMKEMYIFYSFVNRNNFVFLYPHLVIGNINAALVIEIVRQPVGVLEPTLCQS
jgi:hypothetical protein